MSQDDINDALDKAQSQASDPKSTMWLIGGMMLLLLLGGSGVVNRKRIGSAFGRARSWVKTRFSKSRYKKKKYRR